MPETGNSVFPFFRVQMMGQKLKVIRMQILSRFVYLPAGPQSLISFANQWLIHSHFFHSSIPQDALKIKYTTKS